jgi:predicted transcriptional regulator
VPFDRLKVYLSDLASLGLIEDATSCIITQKGKDYMAEYKAVIEFMERMGISYQ